jgi:MSHA biogenesis protein MshE
MVEPTDLLALDQIENILGAALQIVLVNESGLLNVINNVYRRTEDIASFAKELTEELSKEKIAFRSNEENVVGDDASPVARLLDSIFEDAMQVGASDVHIEPEANLVRIRQRVDGLLQESIIQGRQIADSLILRIKLLAKLNISEKRIPQDGRFHIKVKNHLLDIRAATMPVRYGETAVLRLLDQSNGILEVNQLGFREDLLDKLLFHIRRPNGLILVTGPTGSGKTTTLYAVLNELNTKEKKIITIEDPIEYSLNRISQVQVNPAIGLTFAKILRTALRQDPEIIMVGEMRDEETATNWIACCNDRTFSTSYSSY